MTDKNRESKIIAAVACPRCQTPIGRPCRVVGGRPMVCTERKQAWQQQNATRPADYVYQPQPADRENWMLVCPQSEAARQHLQTIAETAPRLRDAQWVGGALRVSHAWMPDLTRRLIAAGWKTADGL